MKKIAIVVLVIGLLFPMTAMATARDGLLYMGQNVQEKIVDPSQVHPIFPPRGETAIERDVPPYIGQNVQEKIVDPSQVHPIVP